MQNVRCSVRLISSKSTLDTGDTSAFKREYQPVAELVIFQLPFTEGSSHVLSSSLQGGTILPCECSFITPLKSPPRVLFLRHLVGFAIPLWMTPRFFFLRILNVIPSGICYAIRKRSLSLYKINKAQLERNKFEILFFWMIVLPSANVNHQLLPIDNL